MPARAVFGLFLMCVILVASIACAPDKKKTGGGQYRSLAVVIKFKDGTQPFRVTRCREICAMCTGMPSVDALNRKHEVLAIVEVNERNRIYRFLLPDKSRSLASEIAREYAGDPNIESAESEYGD
jgi:hypothetical protein